MKELKAGDTVWAIGLSKRLKQKPFKCKLVKIEYCKNSDTWGYIVKPYSIAKGEYLLRLCFLVHRTRKEAKQRINFLNSFLDTLGEYNMYLNENSEI
jgi:hypothetical protein